MQRCRRTTQQLIFLLTLPLFLLFLTACGGQETAVFLPSSLQTATETAVSTATPSVSLQSVDIAPAATTAYEEAGLSTSAGGRFVSLDDPVMIPANQATWLQPDDIVIGVVQNDDARAYPIKQAAYHHIINDTIGGEPYLVTY